MLLLDRLSSSMAGLHLQNLVLRPLVLIHGRNILQLTAFTEANEIHVIQELEGIHHEHSIPFGKVQRRGHYLPTCPVGTFIQSFHDDGSVRSAHLGLGKRSIPAGRQKWSQPTHGQLLHRIYQWLS